MLNTFILLSLLIVIVAFSLVKKNRLLEGFDSGNANATGPNNWNSAVNSQLNAFYPGCSYITASEASVNLRELSVLIDKIDAMQYDISTSGSSTLKSVAVPYNTNQDLEPAGYLVGRCLRKVIRERDINLQMDQFQKRGETLVQELEDFFPGSAQQAMYFLTNKVNGLKQLMMSKCLKTQPRLDIPDSPRDPAYYETEELEELRATSTFLPWV
jgi:hypothetical protein